jgi:phage terminase large subunit-like protein
LSTSTGSSPVNSASPRRRARASRAPNPPPASSTSTSPERVDCGYRACDFIQDLCPNTIGRDAGKLIVLRPWQHDILHGLFDTGGQPNHRYGYIGLPRKNGKSTLGAALALYALVALGEPGAQVYSCAGDRKQASIVFDEAKRMVQQSELREVVRVQRWHLEGPRNSVYRVLSADAELQQGLNPSFVIFDEVHVQPNRDLWDAMVLGMGARERPMIVGITTAGFDRTTLAWDLYERGQRGELYYWWQEPTDPNADWRDEAVWAQANPALGDFLRMEALREDSRITPESSFRRYHLNQWTTTHSAWLPHGVWQACEDKVRAVTPDEPVVLFLDGSWANDSTGIVGCTIRAPHHLFKVGLWTPDAGLGHIDMGAVERGLRGALAAYNVREVAFDPRGFQDFFSRFEAEGFPVTEWQTNSLNRMVPACEEFYRAVLSKGITHDGDPSLAQHLANAVLKEDRYGSRIVKESKTSARKIDLAVCAVGALSQAMLAAAMPAPVVPRFIPFD